MNCFNHQDRPAVCICRSCAKALCPECLTELQNGNACTNSCEERVDLINQMIDNNNKIMSAANTKGKGAAIFIIIMGAIFAGWGIFDKDVFCLCLGAVFLIYGVFSLRPKERYPEVKS